MDNLTVTLIARDPGGTWQLAVVPGQALPWWRRHYLQVRVLVQRPVPHSRQDAWIDAQVPLDQWPAGVVPVTTARDPALLPPLPPVAPGAPNPVLYPSYEQIPLVPATAAPVPPREVPPAGPAPRASRVLPILEFVGTVLGLTMAGISLFWYQRAMERERTGRREAETELQRLREERAEARAG